MAHRRFTHHRRPLPYRASGRAAAWIGVLALSTMLAGCPYRVDISQGNVVEQEDIAQVEVGMTRSQVQFLLGTPMISDPFHADRWDYPYYYIRGRRGEVARRWFSVHFENDRVARIEHHIGADGSAGSSASTAPESEVDVETAARDD